MRTLEQPKYRIVFLDSDEEYLKPTGFSSEWEAREFMKHVHPRLRPVLLKVVELAQ